MVSLLAWPRAFAFLFTLATSITYAAAQVDSIFTSSVTYCNPPETLLIQRFELAFFPANTSVSFNVSAASVQSNVNVTANVFLNVYGMNPVNFTLDLCGILHGALCPLPMYNFTGADSLSLPSQLSVLQQIPGIAYKIPDLEGFAQLTLTDIKTGKVRACVQATLSNGRSAHQRAVVWTTGGISIAALVVAFGYSLLSSQYLIPFRLLDLLYLFQSIASSAFLNVNYPSVYRAFALNFAWAMGLLSSSPDDSGLQNSINRMRHITGGNLADATGASAVGLVNRKLSPYNSLSTSTLTESFGIVTSYIATRALNLTSHVFTARDTIPNGEVQTVTAVSSNVLQAGFPIYVNTLHIATANAFMTVFLITLCLIAIFIGVFALGYGVMLNAQRFSKKKYQQPPSDFHFISFAFTWFLRMGLVVVYPLLIFIFYQWTLKDSWLTVLLSVITFLALIAIFVYSSFAILRFVRQGSASALYEHKNTKVTRNGPLYAQYRHQRYYFFIPLLAAFVLRAIFISFAKPSGEAQLALLIVLEAFLVLLHFILKPAKTKGGDVFATYLAIVRLVCTGLMIAFLENLRVKAIPRVVIGIVIALVWSVAVVIVILNFMWHTIAGFVFLLRGKPLDTSSSAEKFASSSNGSEGSMLEKGIRGNESGSTKSKLMVSTTGDSAVSLPYVITQGDINGNPVFTSSIPSTNSHSSIAEVARTRPVNPTPETGHHSSFGLDTDDEQGRPQYLAAAFPISPTTTVATMEPPSLYSSRDSGTITIGSLLPRRWSFSLSQPGSPQGSSLSHGQQSVSQYSHMTGTGSVVPSPLPPSTPSDGSHSHGQQSTASSPGNGNSRPVSRTNSIRASKQVQPRPSDIAEEEEGGVSSSERTVKETTTVTSTP